jgi:uncharacterized protein (DUF1684 family)
MKVFSREIGILRAVCIGTVVAAAFQGCGRKSPEPSVPVEDTLLRDRIERDRVFKSGQDSPIPPSQRAQFKGLEYFPPDPALRFRVKLNRHPTPLRIRIGTNTGEVRSGLRYGYFEFAVDGKPCRLQVYRFDDEPPQSGAPYLFVPFRDATSGTESYAAGRYIDLRENTSGFYDLDFNRAYNPSCAYAEGFSCPVPPEENRLAVPIRAGERKYSGAPPH